MNFIFGYEIADEIKKVAITIDDAVVAEAQKIGVDAVALEAEVKAAIDALIGRVTQSHLWEAAKAMVKHVGAEFRAVEHVISKDVQELVKQVQEEAAKIEAGEKPV